MMPPTISDFARKAFAGKRTTPSDWRAHLRHAHSRAPGMSPALFGVCRDADGATSYKVLADSLGACASAAPRVIDLACGDGSLIPYCLAKLPPGSKIIGVDMSEAELRLAKRRGLGRDAELRRGLAEDLGEPSRSIDAVLCHMAFMLMSPIDPVVKEIHRVLKPGGIFAAAIPGGSYDAGIYRWLRPAIQDFIRSKYPAFRPPGVRDARLDTKQGLADILSGQGRFRAVEIDDRHFGCLIRPDGVWNLVKDMYFVGMLPPERRLRLKRELIGLASRYARGGTVYFDLPCRIFRACAQPMGALNPAS